MNRADQDIRYDQSNIPGYRTPSRDYERLAWERRRRAILEGWAEGLTAEGIRQRIPTEHSNAANRVPAMPTVRAWFQRIYNELGLTSGRTPAAALTEAYRAGWLPCPCGKIEARRGKVTWTNG